MSLRSLGEILARKAVGATGIDIYRCYQFSFAKMLMMATASLNKLLFIATSTQYLGEMCFIRLLS